MNRTMLSFLSQDIRDLVTQAFTLLEGGTPEDRRETAKNLISRAEELKRTAEDTLPERRRLLVEAETLIVTAYTLTRSKLPKAKVSTSKSTSTKVSHRSTSRSTSRSTVLSASQQHQKYLQHLTRKWKAREASKARNEARKLAKKSENAATAAPAAPAVALTLRSKRKAHSMPASWRKAARLAKAA